MSCISRLHFWILQNKSIKLEKKKKNANFKKQILAFADKCQIGAGGTRIILITTLNGQDIKAAFLTMSPHGQSHPCTLS